MQTCNSLQILCVFSTRAELNELIPKIQLSKKRVRESAGNRESRLPTLL